MKTKHFVKIIAASFIISACNGGTVTDGSNTSTGSDVACVTDLQAAMDDYYALISDDNLDNDPASAPVECDLPTPIAPSEQKLTINAVLRDFSATQEEKMREALRRAEIVLNSEEFKQRVLDFTWNGERQFNDNNGQSNEEIYETIMKGAETLLPEIDYEADLDITLYYKLSSTVGYTYPDTTRVWVNSRFFNGYNYGQVAANAIHEWTHKLGYGHDYNNNSDRPYSVPYGIGGIINQLVNNL